MLELITLDNTIRLDIRYARNDNFVGRAVYKEARAFLQPSAAESLLRVHAKLTRISHKGGTGACKLIIVHDLRGTAHILQPVPKHILEKFGFGFPAKTPKP